MTKKEFMKLADAQVDEKVKIQGTDYDRKRVMTTKMINRANKLLKEGKKPFEVASKLKVSLKAIRYNTEPEYRASILANASGKHTGTDTMTFDNRVAYKRKLVKWNRVTI